MTTTTKNNLINFPRPATDRAVPRTSPRYRVVATPTSNSTPMPGILGQIREATRNRAALMVGAVFGAWVPLASYWVAHHEIPSAVGYRLAALVAFVVAGLTYSARKVYRWSCLAHGEARYWTEALGFTLLTEGVMVISGEAWLRVAALGLLIAINALASGVTIARGK